MSTNNSDSVTNRNDVANKEQQASKFFNNNNNNNCGIKENTLGVNSVTDSAYDSLVCSPFSPTIISNSNKSNPSDNQENFSNTLDSISPFLELGENDDVFKVSLEQIYIEQKPKMSICRSIFRPITSEREITNNSNDNRRDSFEDVPQSNVMLREFLYNNPLKSHRSISTQTKFSLGSIGFYRPNSAPLQEGIEEELSEIETNAIESSSFQIPRNSTCYCIRSPMPDLIQPTFQRDNQLLVSRLSLIADQIDQDMSPVSKSVPRHLKRTRRFSTPSMTEITPGGSFLDLLISIYQAFDKRQPRRRSATFSHNENDERQQNE